MEAKGQVTSSKANPDVSSDGALKGNNTSRVRADFEGLLALAESLNHSFNENKESYLKYNIIQQSLVLLLSLEVCFGFIIFILSTGFGSPTPHTHFLHFPITVTLASADVFLVLATAFYACTFWFRSQVSKSLSRVDQRDLTEVVELLREIEPVVAREESLSALERVQIRIRLSRFGVGSLVRNSATAASKELEADFHARAARVDQELAKPF